MPPMKRPRLKTITRTYSLPAELDEQAERFLARLRVQNPDLDRSTWLRGLIREKVNETKKAA